MNPSRGTVLYRAHREKPYLGRGSHWTPQRECAEAYQDNQGFGGHVLYQTTVDDPFILRLIDPLTMPGSAARERRAFEILAKELDEEGWRGSIKALKERGLSNHIYGTWENDPSILELLARGYEWVAYEDDYPVACETWRYLGSSKINATKVHEE